MVRLFLTFLLLFPAFAYAGDDAPLPLPRFASFKSDEVNMRSGPGTRYPIVWLYHRDGWPVEITEEFDHWRKIRDAEGTQGWVHKNMLEGRRHVIIKKDIQLLHRAPDDTAPPILRAEPMVIAKLLECNKEWCRIQIDSRKGWVRKKFLWGVKASEEFD